MIIVIALLTVQRYLLIKGPTVNNILKLKLQKKMLRI